MRTVVCDRCGNTIRDFVNPMMEGMYEAKNMMVCAKIPGFKNYASFDLCEVCVKDFIAWLGESNLKAQVKETPAPPVTKRVRMTKTKKETKQK